MKAGLLIVVSAPSGCGKGTILREVMKDGGYYYSVSATTRKPRENEIHGKDYFFITEDEFKRCIDSGEMLEYTVYCGYYYGTLRQPVYDRLSSGEDVILEIEVDGARQIRNLCPDAVFIFFQPPSLEALRSRLLERNSECDEIIQQRLTAAQEELKHTEEYDYAIVNETVQKAVDDFKAAVRAEKLKRDSGAGNKV
ncbi:MAG: guanylate kinase [Oscillospiraceae bacterium]|nr:guanylate kinase [Oscillospiraceae bacterium]